MVEPSDCLMSKEIQDTAAAEVSLDFVMRSWVWITKTTNNPKGVIPN